MYQGLIDLRDDWEAQDDYRDFLISERPNYLVLVSSDREALDKILTNSSEFSNKGVSHEALVTEDAYDVHTEELESAFDSLEELRDIKLLEDIQSSGLGEAIDYVTASDDISEEKDSLVYHADDGFEIRKTAKLIHGDGRNFTVFSESQDTLKQLYRELSHRLF
jgi:hypothetical protein